LTKFFAFGNALCHYVFLSKSERGRRISHFLIEEKQKISEILARKENGKEHLFFQSPGNRKGKEDFFLGFGNGMETENKISAGKNDKYGPQHRLSVHVNKHIRNMFLFQNVGVNYVRA